jgi:hypothetical protein
LLKLSFVVPFWVIATIKIRIKPNKRTFFDSDYGSYPVPSIHFDVLVSPCWGFKLESEMWLNGKKRPPRIFLGSLGFPGVGKRTYKSLLPFEPPGNPWSLVCANV